VLQVISYVELCKLLVQGATKIDKKCELDLRVKVKKTVSICC